MLPFFQAFSAGEEVGTFVHLQSLIGQLNQERWTGMLDIRGAGAMLQGVVLLADGETVGVGLVDQRACKRIALEEMGQSWQGGEATLYKKELPRQAIRLVKATFEWYPPRQTVSTTGDKLADFLRIGQQRQVNGLFYICSGQTEAFLTLLDGMLLEKETLWVTPAGFEIGKSLQQILSEIPQTDCTLTLFDAGLANNAMQQIGLRYALADLLQGVVNRYRRIVGVQLAEALAANINQVMAERGLHIEIKGDVLQDTHVFPSGAAAIQTARLTLQVAMKHMANVIGTGLVSSILIEVFHSLKPGAQQIIRDSPLLVMVLSSR